MSCKSALYTNNSTTQLIASGGTVPFGSVIRRFGNNVNLGGSGILVSGQGYYDVSVSATVAPSTADAVTMTLYMDGVAVPGATATTTPVAAGDTVNMSLCCLVRERCCEGSSVLTLVVTGAATNVVGISTVVRKV